MWIFTTSGFVSIVADAKRKGHLLVRSRVPGDIEKLFPDATVTENPDRDYRFRASIPVNVVARTMFDLVSDIEYNNFKNEIPLGARHDAYLDVWATMARLQEKGFPRCRPQKGSDVTRTSKSPGFGPANMSDTPTAPGAFTSFMSVRGKGGKRPIKPPAKQSRPVR